MAEAKVLYEKDIERTEADTGTLFRYAVVLFALGNEQEATARFEAALEKEYLPNSELHNLKQYIPLKVMQMFFKVIDRTYPDPERTRGCTAAN
jgi:hypothetical protein